MRAGLISAGRIADAGGVIADDEDGLVAPVLKLPDDLQRHGMAERDIGRGRVHAELDAQRLILLGRALELGAQLLLGNDPLAAAGENGDLLVDGH